LLDRKKGSFAVREMRFWVMKKVPASGNGAVFRGRVHLLWLVFLQIGQIAEARSETGPGAE
jgi:hypothetical protein